MLILEKLTQVKAFIFDVDGVLSDGRVLITEEGAQLRNMSIKDGYALKKAMESGYLIAIISGGNSQGVKERLLYLGIKEVYLGVRNKIEIFDKLIEEYELKPTEVLYMGDDIPDIEILRKCGVPCCPANAVVEVKEICSYISPNIGGHECVRDVIEKTLKVKGQWM
ncbi:MAG: HAD hydrolase family protein [Bacteroidia bacterium]|jgi:3-deoxy-D-manno-octulosonate 8-phosphate phosphatase (KDO 8-P phosphatase)|nr:HAD hydrolase family protein [Bacteroidia bacterium]MCO5253708.1 HAD hydrolase family protein [Bacteroidota bacterium]MCZ2129152.1 HAD hydrolase family protein [Bacteroidia bacterium]